MNRHGEESYARGAIEATCGLDRLLVAIGCSQLVLSIDF
jgi:hypothetical protein